MAPFREQFFDLLEEHESTKRPRHPPTAKLFKYSVFNNPGVVSDFPTILSNVPAEDAASEKNEYMEQDHPDPDSPTPATYDPDQGYREHARFPSDPDKSSMEEGDHPSFGEEGGARPKYPARQPATKRKLPIGYYDGRVGPPPSTKGGPRTKGLYADKGLETPDNIWDPEATSKFYKDASKLGQKAKKTIGKL